MRVQHRLMAILCADASGYSRRMAQDGLATVAELDAARQVFCERVAGHSGPIVDTAGDSVVAVFNTASGAVDVHSSKNSLKVRSEKSST